jgi:hypothetical protein
MPQNDPAAAMRDLRQMMLTASASELGLEPTEEFPLVYGALVELPINNGTVTIVAMHDGNASLYTTGTFGIIGGQAHEAVRSAAIAFVEAAQQYHDEAAPTTDYPYPQPDRARFYLLTYQGVRFIDTDMASLQSGDNAYFPLFARGNDVLTELRKVAMASEAN